MRASGLFCPAIPGFFDAFTAGTRVNEGEVRCREELR